jgi:hypothetical protein
VGECGRWQGKLPRVTVQMPVYLEGFDFVIKPSIRSLQAAIAAYKAEGGSASIYVNEDGLQLLSEDERLVSTAETKPCMIACMEAEPTRTCLLKLVGLL